MDVPYASSLVDHGGFASRGLSSAQDTECLARYFSRNTAFRFLYDDCQPAVEAWCVFFQSSNTCIKSDAFYPDVKRLVS